MSFANLSPYLTNWHSHKTHKTTVSISRCNRTLLLFKSQDNQLKYLLLLLLLHTALDFLLSPNLSEVYSPLLWWLTKAVASSLMRYKKASQSANFWFKCFLKMYLCYDSVASCKL